MLSSLIALLLSEKTLTNEFHRRWRKKQRLKFMCSFKSERILSRNRIQNYIDLVEKYSDYEFKHNFRMKKSTFHVLMNIIPYYKKKPKGGRPKIAKKSALLMTITLLVNSHLTYRMIADRFNVSESTAYIVTKTIIRQISLLRKKYIKWPTSYEVEVFNFNETCANAFPNVIGCIDCTHIVVPGKIDNSYLDRNKNHSIILQAVCDSKLYFTDIYCGWPGSVHDARVWKHSPLFNKLQRNELNVPFNFHLIGDSAYPLDNFLMVPFKNSSSFGSRERRYNQILSKTRYKIELAFGLLKTRFRRLLSGVETRDVQLASETVAACCVLHNICIAQNDDLEIDSQIMEVDILNIEEETGIIHSNAKTKRDGIKNLIT